MEVVESAQPPYCRVICLKSMMSLALDCLEEDKEGREDLIL